MIAGFVVSLTAISSILSYSALLFAGAPLDVQAQGLFSILLSALVLGIVGAAMSTLRISFLTVDGASTAALSTITAPLIAGLTGASPGVLGATLSVGLAGVTALAGLALIGLGWVRGGAVVRFLPVQLLAGLLAGTGWSLSVGGAAVAVGSKLTPGLLLLPGTWVHFLPAVALAIAITGASRRVHLPVVIPALLLIGAGLHHLVFANLGMAIERQQAEGWLLPTPGRLVWSFPWTPNILGLVDWAALAQQAPALGATVAVICLLVLVNAGSLELQARQDVDLDRDLRANGAANLMTGLVGGILGNLSPSRSGALHRMGAKSRLTTMAAAAAAGLLPMALPGLIGLVPRWVLGALVLFMGLNLLDTWVLQVRKGLSPAEWLTVPVVLAVSVFFGLPAAVFAGLTMGCATFALMYSRASPIRARYRGDVAQSNVDRPDEVRTLLQGQANAILVLYLQGFLFFGTASRLLTEVKAELVRSSKTLKFLVLDCSNTDGLDGSARAILERMHQVTASYGVTLIYAALPAAAQARLGALLRPKPGLEVLPTLDIALERIELALLDGHAVTGARLTLDDVDPAHADTLELALVRNVVPAGHVLMTQGQTSNDLLFIVRGHAEVMVSFDGAAPIRVRQFGPGTMVGEIGFLLGTPRTATVLAVTECETRSLTRAEISRLEAEHPGAVLALQRAVMARLSRRLLDKDHLIAMLVRGNSNQNDRYLRN